MSWPDHRRGNPDETAKKRRSCSTTACTCNEDHLGKTPGPALATSHAALGVVPASEVATWTRIAPSADGLAPRSLRTATFDETRKVVVTFGGQADNSSAWGRVVAEALPASQYLWEWNPAAGAWTNRAPTGELLCRRLPTVDERAFAPVREGLTDSDEAKAAIVLFLSLLDEQQRRLFARDRIAQAWAGRRPLGRASQAQTLSFREYARSQRVNTHPPRSGLAYTMTLRVRIIRSALIARSPFAMLSS